VRSDLLSVPGAVEAGGIDTGVAAHYGDPIREQRLLAEGLAVVDLSHRGVVTVSGPDRLDWLHSLTTQQLADLAPYRSAETLVLSPHGHIEHALHLVDDGVTTWLSVEPGTAGDLVAWLDRMRFMRRVEVVDHTEAYAVLGEPVDAEAQPGEPMAWRDPWPGPVGDTACYGPASDQPGSDQPGSDLPGSAHPGSDLPGSAHPGSERAWRELIVPRDQLRAAVGDRALAGTWAAEAARVAAWRPRLGAETDHRTIPHEVDWLRTAVHLHKGCYRGQETVARVHNLGKPPRRIVFGHLDGSGHTLPSAGEPLHAGGRPVGRLTTVARHWESGPIALAVVRRNTPPDAVLTAGDVAVAQTVVVAP